MAEYETQTDSVMGHDPQYLINLDDIVLVA
jgi:hypothetical protein